MKTCNKKGKHPITIVLSESVHKILSDKAKAEKRPIAQMARVIIETALENDY
jgi:hypothetical protein